MVEGGTPFRSALTAASYIVAHLIVAIVLIAAVETISLILAWLVDPKLFDRVPIRYMFHTMDVAILTIFIRIDQTEIEIIDLDYEDYH